MLRTILRINSIWLRDTANALCIWTVNDGPVKYAGRHYHSCMKQNFLFPIGVTLKTYKSTNKCTKLTYTATPNLDSSSISAKSGENANEFFKNHNIIVRGNNVPPPFLSIQEAGFPPFINTVLETHNVLNPTPIQSVAWPIVMEGRDFVGISPTGSGKTLAYAVPLVIKVKRMKSEHKTGQSRSPFALVLSPTRELAKQIGMVFSWFEGPSLSCTAVYGGVMKQNQLGKIYRGVDILVATPGRCHDLLNSGDISLDMCSFIVLDEADQMLDMGFLPQIEPIIENIQCQRQSVMWSATWPKEVVDIASRFLTNYIHVSVGSLELKPNENVKQTFVFCDNNREKNDRLVEFLKDVTESRDAKVLIFVERRRDVHLLECRLREKGFYVSSVHGDKSQNAREMCLKSFRGGTVQILIATAVAARGIDVDNITHVVNFDCPKTSGEYIHKIGRTGRLDKKGKAITYVMTEDAFAGYLVDMCRQSNQEVPDELLRFEKLPTFSNRNYYTMKKKSPYFFNSRQQNFKNARYKRNHGKLTHV